MGRPPASTPRCLGDLRGRAAIERHSPRGASCLTYGQLSGVTCLVPPLVHAVRLEEVSPGGMTVHELPMAALHSFGLPAGPGGSKPFGSGWSWQLGTVVNPLLNASTSSMHCVIASWSLPKHVVLQSTHSCLMSDGADEQSPLHPLT